MSPGTDSGRPADPAIDLVALQPGHAVGRYRIVAVLGQGGFGITYRARDEELGREVAIKEYLPAALALRAAGMTVVPRSQGAAADLAWGRERFIAEGRTLAALQRAPGIVKVHDFIEAHGTAYLVMELVEGETLHERLSRRGTLDAEALGRFLQPLLDGLERVHAAGFLHRDIKPANILLGGDGQPTLIDFGASRLAVAGRSQAMTAVFTPGYAPVEQFTSAPQGPWTDIYSLAATLHHAITGRAPANAVDRMLDDGAAPLAGRGLPYPASLLAGIDAGLRVRAADRPQSIAAWRAMMAGERANAEATVALRKSDGAPQRRRAAAPRIGRVAGAAGIAVLAALAVGGWLAWRTPTAPTAAQPAAAVPAAAASTLPTQQEVEQARRDKRAAEEEAVRLRSEAEARRKADEQADLRRTIEAELRQQAEQAASEEKARVDREAATKAETEAAARQAAADGERKAADAEGALGLTMVDRQRLQAALAAVGFATGGNDGVFGRRSREMIAAWQRKSGRPASGYFTAEAQAALLREAAPALTRLDQERAAQAPAQAQPAAGTACEGTRPSQWCRAAYQGFPPSCWNASMAVRNGEIVDGWSSTADRSQRNVVSGRIDAAGNVLLVLDGIGQQTHVNQRFRATMSGRVVDGVLTASGRAGLEGREFSVRVQCR